MKNGKKWTTQFKHLVIGICALFVVFAFGSTALAGFIYDATTYGEEEKSDYLVEKEGYVDIDFRYVFYSDLNTTDLSTADAEKSDVYDSDGTLIGDADAEITIAAADAADDVKTDDPAKNAYYALNEFLVGHTNLSAELAEGTYTAVDTKVSQGDAVTGYEGIMYTIVVSTTIQKNEDFTTLGECTYEGVYMMYAQSYTCYYSTKQSSDTVRKELSVPSGYSLTDTYVANLFSNGVDGYTFYGLIDAVEQDSTYVPSESLSLTYSYGDAITENKHFYAIFTKSSSGTSSITTAVNETVSGATTNIYIGSGQTNCNVATDSTYVESIKNVGLGSATIQEGATVNLCLNSANTQRFSSYNTEPYDADTNPTGYYLKVEPQEENRQYTVSLQADLNVNGTLVIGGTYGSGITYATQGNINSYYVVLDLNGHKINVSSTGSIICYGMIIDSSQNTGTIYLNGGNITTLVVMLDYKDFNNTFACATSYVCPFQLYFIPYLRCRVEFTYDSTNGWGEIDSFCRVHASSVALLGMLQINGLATDLYLNLIGPTPADDDEDPTHFIFELETPESGKEDDASVVYEYKTLDGVLSDADASAEDLEYINDYSLYVRNCITFNNVTFTMGSLDITFTVYLLSQYIPITVGYADDFNFPISPFFDITLNGSTFNLDSMVQFEAGSSLTVDSESTILFTTSTYSGAPYSSDTTFVRFGSLSALDKGINYYDKELSTFVEGNAMNGKSLEAKGAADTTTDEEGNLDTYFDMTASLTTFVDDTVWGNETLWKYLGGASVNIMGKILFDCPDSSTEVTNMKNTGGYYRIAGEINFIEDNVGILYYDSSTSTNTEIMYTDITAGTYDSTIVEMLVELTGNTYSESYYDYYVSTLGLSSVLSYLKALDPFSALAILAGFMNRPIFVQTYGYDFIPNQYEGGFALDEDELEQADFYTLITYMCLLDVLYVPMNYAASNARAYARPLVSYGKAYVVNSIDNSSYYGIPSTMYEGTFDFDTGIFTATKCNTIDFDKVMSLDFTNGLVTTEPTSDNLYYFDTYDSDIYSADESSTTYSSLADELNTFTSLLPGDVTVATVDSKYNTQTPTVKYTSGSYTYDLPNYNLTLTQITGQDTDSIGPYITSEISGESKKYRYFAGIYVMDSEYYTDFQMTFVNYMAYLLAYSGALDDEGNLDTTTFYSSVPTYQTMVESLFNAVQPNLYTNLNAVTTGNSGNYTVAYVGRIFSWANCSMAVLYYDSTCQCYKYDQTYSSAVLNLEVNFANLLNSL